MQIANQNLENVVLNIIKLVLHNFPLLETKLVIDRINRISADELLSLASQIFDRDKLSVLTYVE